jgi:hypothetical protein
MRWLSRRGMDVLTKVQRRDQPYKLYARTPEEITEDLTTKIYGEQGKEYA